MSDIRYYTKAGLEKLKAQLQDLKTRGRSEMASQIAEAREKGDLSENAEYDAAKEAQGLMETRIAQLEKLILNARVMEEQARDTSKVSVLSHVTIQHMAQKQTMRYQLVSEEEADVKQSKISVASPIGQALLGKTVGEVARIEAPSGHFEVKVIQID